MYTVTSILYSRIRVNSAVNSGTPGPIESTNCHMMTTYKTVNITNVLYFE